jgi:hypothetical protein
LRVFLRSKVLGLRLAVVMRAFEGGGAERDMVLLCNALAAKGVNVTVQVLQSSGPPARIA